MKRQLIGYSVFAIALTLAISACGDSDATIDDETDNQHNNNEHNNDNPPLPTIWYFSADAETNTWHATVTEPDTNREVTSFTIAELGQLSGPSSDGGNEAGPAWGDAIVGPDGRRVFINAMNVNRVVVLDAVENTLDALLEVGERPVHIYNPNHNDEIWTHVDGIGAFHLIDPVTLEVSAPLTAALTDSGHGKLLYSHELGTKYYATNTNDAGVFPIDGEMRTVGAMISLCGQPCADDAEQTCGGTHDKIYNPRMNWAIFQCSGVSRNHYAFVDAETDEVVHDMVAMSGSVAHSPDYAYILLFGGDEVQIWDTNAAEHDGLTFDATVTIEGAPNARGTEFRQNSAGQWEAWIPLTAAPSLAVLNLSTMDVELLEIGVLTKPEGASHFGRRAALGEEWLATYNDDGAVFINLETRDVVQGPAIPGLVSRVMFTSPDDHQNDHQSSDFCHE